MMYVFIPLLHTPVTDLPRNFEQPASPRQSHPSLTSHKASHPLIDRSLLDEVIVTSHPLVDEVLRQTAGSRSVSQQLVVDEP